MKAKWLHEPSGTCIMLDGKQLIRANNNGRWGIYLNGYLVRQGRKNNLEDAQVAGLACYNKYFAELPRIDG